MKKTMLMTVCGLILMGGEAFAQNRSCGADLIKDRMTSLYPQGQQIFEQRQQRIQSIVDVQETNGSKQKTTAYGRIPVVFHIVLTQTQIDQLGGISGIEQRAFTQMDVINRDFSKRNTDTSLIPAAFKPLAAASNIEFGLAHRKPNGTSTPGYEVNVISASSIDINQGGSAGSGYFGSDAKYASTGGAPAWDPTKYLNIWVINPSSSGILGLTVSPDLINSFGFPSAEMGIVLTYGAFGRRTSISQYFLSGIDKGRTLTHELGHYFELAHIWGDDPGCPPSTDDDGISDTPPQADQHFGCPSFPAISCANGPNGDMFMNYMDYVNDGCMQMFTMGQVNRMNAMAQAANESLSLTQHPELTEYPTAVADVDADKAFHVYPNPSNGVFTLSFNEVKGLEAITVSNMMGQHVHNIAIADRKITNYNIDLSGMGKGVYMVQCTFATGTITKKIILQ